MIIRDAEMSVFYNGYGYPCIKPIIKIIINND